MVSGGGSGALYRPRPPNHHPRLTRTGGSKWFRRFGTTFAVLSDEFENLRGPVAVDGVVDLVRGGVGVRVEVVADLLVELVLDARNRIVFVVLSKAKASRNVPAASASRCSACSVRDPASYESELRLPVRLEVGRAALPGSFVAGVVDVGDGGAGRVAQVAEEVEHGAHVELRVLVEAAPLSLASGSKAISRHLREPAASRSRCRHALSSRRTRLFAAK